MTVVIPTGKAVPDAMSLVKVTEEQSEIAGGFQVAIALHDVGSAGIEMLTGQFEITGLV